MDDITVGTGWGSRESFEIPFRFGLILSDRAMWDAETDGDQRYL
jgi:hypothetical protein